jgi:programmed cell death 6-interacting protein
LELFKGAQQRSGKPNHFQDCAKKAQRNLIEAKEDNNFIYHEKIPEAMSLPAVGKVMLTKSFPVPRENDSKLQR